MPFTIVPVLKWTLQTWLGFEHVLPIPLSANITYGTLIETPIALLYLWWNIMAFIIHFMIAIIVTHLSESIRGLWLFPPLELKHQWPHGLTERGHWSIAGSGERKSFRPWKCPVKIYYSNLSLWLEELTQGIFRHTETEMNIKRPQSEQVVQLLSSRDKNAIKSNNNDWSWEIWKYSVDRYQFIPRQELGWLSITSCVIRLDVK